MCQRACAILCVAGALLGLGLAGSAQAQAPATPGQNPAQAQTVLVVPEPETLLALIRTTLIAVNQANMTGNYTVLRDIGAPSFQTVNSAAKLGIAFAKMREQNVDLSPIAVVTPQVSEPPTITELGLLRVVGAFPTRPLQVNFQILFQAVNGKWRMFGLSVSADPAQPAPQAEPGATPKAPPGKKQN